MELLGYNFHSTLAVQKYKGEYNKMKKILAFTVAVAITAVSFAGCGAKNKYAKGTTYSEGVLLEDSYENASVGLGFNLPNGFEFVDMGEAMGEAEYIVAATDADSNNIIWTLEPGDSNLNMDKTLKLSLDTIVAQYESMNFDVSESSVTEYTIGSNTYGGFNMTVSYNGLELNQAGILVQCDDKIVTVAITCSTVDAEDILKDCFYTVG